MQPFHRLPHELVLLVAERAAWDEVHNHKGWTAALRLVSREFRKVVTPILFQMLVITPSAIDCLIELSASQDTPLFHTRQLVFTLHVDTRLEQVHTTCTNGTIVSCLIDPEFAPVARALPNLHCFTGSHELLEALAHFNPDLRLSSAHLTDSASVWSSSTSTGTRRCFNLAVSAIPRIHILIELSNRAMPDAVLSLQAQFILVDVWDALLRGPVEQAVTALLAGLDTMLLRGSLLRLTVRLRVIHASRSLQIAHRITAHGLARREPRLWLEDDHVVGMVYEPQQYDPVILEEVMKGDALWSIGRQVYNPAALATGEAGITA